MAAPEFDPSKPFETVSEAAPEFDPSKPFETVSNKGVGATAWDAAKQLGSGVVAGLESIPAAVPTLLGYAGKGVEALGVGDKSAIEERDKLKKLIDTNRKGGVSQYLPTPETTVGKYARTLGEFAPAAAVAPGSVAQRAILGTAVPAVASETAGQLTEGTSAEPWARLGAAVVAPGAASRVVTPINTAAGRAALAAKLEGEGVNAMTAGQRTGSKTLQYAESALGDFPGAGGKATAAQETANRQFTEAVLRRTGMPAGIPPTREALNKHITNLEDGFKQLAANNTVQFDRQFSNDITRTLQRYDRKLPSQQKDVISNIVQDLTRYNGSMPGAHYQPLRSDLSKMAKGSAEKDPIYADALRGMRDALDSAMARSIKPQDAAAWQQLRKYWGNWKTISSAAKETDAAGNVLITPARLKEAASAKDRSGFARGEAEYADLAQAGSQLLRTLPQSGTAPRTMLTALPTLAGSILGFGHGGPEMAAAAGLAAGLGTSAGAGRAIMHPWMQTYLRNQVLKGPRDSAQAAALRAALSQSE